MKQLNNLFSVFSTKPLMLLFLFVLLPSMASAQSTNIEFADATVKQICIDKWDKNLDRELSYDEAAAVTNIREAFCNRSDITSFDELQYFTSLKEVYFRSCYNLVSVTIPNSVTTISEASL